MNTHLPRSEQTQIAITQPIITKLNQYTILEVTGLDAKIFLQGQLTCDLEQIQEPSLGACCDRKGRMIANFWIWLKEEIYYLLIPQNISDILLNHLKKYILRSKVQLTKNNKFMIVGISQAEKFHSEDREITVISYPDFFKRKILIGATTNMINMWNKIGDVLYLPIGCWAWNLLDIRSGIIFIQNETKELFTPQMLNWQHLGGVSFKKGCYTGQEIIARTQHLGQLKRHLYHAEINSEELPKLAEEIVNPKQETIGIIVEAAPSDQNLIELALVLQDHAINDPIYLKNTLIKNIKRCEV